MKPILFATPGENPDERVSFWDLHSESGKDLSHLRESVTGPAMLTLGTHCQGRPQRWHQALSAFELLNLDATQDWDAISQEIPPARRMLSWQGEVASLEEAQSRLAQLSTQPARWYRLIIEAKNPAQCLVPLQLLQAAKREDVIAYAAGWQGSWTRLLAPHFGAPLLFASGGDAFWEPGAFPIQRLVQDFGFPNLISPQCLSGILGATVHASGSPAIHNTAYRALALRWLFVPLQVERFEDFLPLLEGWNQLGMKTPGFVVVAPHKQDLLQWAAKAGAEARQLGCANVLVHQAGQWIARTTDLLGLRQALLGQSIHARPAAVVGLGGAGLGATAALKELGAQVSLVNRNEEKGREIAQILNLPFIPLSHFRARDFEIVVNATATGKAGEAALFSLHGMASNGIFAEYPYGPQPTQLCKQAKDQGLFTISGHDMLRIQAAAQFAMISGKSMPQTNDIQKNSPEVCHEF